MHHGEQGCVCTKSGGQYRDCHNRETGISRQGASCVAPVSQHGFQEDQRIPFPDVFANASLTAKPNACPPECLLRRNALCNVLIYCLLERGLEFSREFVVVGAVVEKSA